MKELKVPEPSEVELVSVQLVDQVAAQRVS